MKTCPHPDIRFCPLYVMAHEGGGYGCDDGMIDGADGECAVARKLDYGQAVAKLCRFNPEIVRDLAAAESAEASRRQRARNMKLAGLH